MSKNLNKLSNGSIIKMDFSPTKGHEQTGTRPALVISNPNRLVPLNGMVFVAPISNSKKGFPTHVDIDNEQLKTTGCILLEHCRWVDLGHRDFSVIEALDEETFEKVIKITKALIFGE